MKICPACRTQYSDDEQQFCFQDGTLLTYYVDLADVPTVVANKSQAFNARAEGPASNHIAGSTQPSGSKMAVVIAATILAMLLLFAAGIGTWFYFNGAQTETAGKRTNKDIAVQSPNVNNRASPTPQISLSPTPSPSAQMPEHNDPKVRDEVLQLLSSWESSAESLDLDEYMTHYADNVDYYNRPRASADFVRADKRRAFTEYDSLSIKLTNISVSVDPTGKQATATMDKEWEFDGDRNSYGKVKQLLKLRKIGGEWFITAEKDLKVYSTR